VGGFPAVRQLCLCLSLCAIWPAAAYQPLITDDTGTQGADGNQIEFAYNHAQSTSFGATSSAYAFPLVYTRGLTDALDVYAGLSQVRIHPEEPEARVGGLANPVMGLKWRFYENEANKLSLGLKPEIQLPRSTDAETRSLGYARTNIGLTFLLTAETGFGQFLANLVVVTNRFELQSNQDSQRRTRYQFSVAPVFEIAEGWKITLDAGVTTSPAYEDRVRVGFIQLGVIYSPTEDLDFAAGILRGVRDGDLRSTTATVGITWRFR
jgi:hypothetical protein